jgi:hypothetical protein
MLIQICTPHKRPTAVQNDSERIQMMRRRRAMTTV